ncbi:isoprenyl transferase [Taibaiella koreensis]|uniref:isoprenyl transferase n=1 Tax=Taibaiella koreensis TaxID=1268548 RepID=UPI000E59A0EA|nr:isoprenyl transferase [Taibaiella koreensis]
MDSKSLIDTTYLPQHIAIIMDGNGRWAKEKGEDRIHGHQQGVISVREVVEGCGEIGIQYLTLYAFSTENWNRPKYEVDALMELLVSTIRKEVDDLKKNNVRLSVIGDFASLPEICRQELNEGMDITSGCTGLNLVLALSYSARWEIVNAVQQVATAVAAGNLLPADIDAATFTQFLCTHDYPDPELMIRTGGEHRISNFLLYQMAYTELYFSDVHWPDFRKEHLFDAILNYQQRERRFGKTSEQVRPS